MNAAEKAVKKARAVLRRARKIRLSIQAFAPVSAVGAVAGRPLGQSGEGRVA